MKILRTALLFLIILIAANTSAQKKDSLLDQFGNPNRYKVSISGSRCTFLFQIDRTTIFCKPYNLAPGQERTNISYLEGTKSLQLSTIVPKDSISYYRYSILLDEKHLIKSNAIPDKIDFVWPDRSANPGMATLNLGRYDVHHKTLKIELYKTTENNQRITGIFYNKPIKPATIESVYKYNIDAKNKKFNFLPIKSGASVSFDDTTEGLLLSIKKTDTYYLYHVYLIDLDKGKTIPLSNNWAQTDFTENPYILINKSWFETGGRYRIKVVPVLSGGFNSLRLFEKAAVVDFSVQKSIELNNSQIAILIFCVVFLFIVAFIILKMRNRKKLVFESKQKETAQLQLSAVRHHLNPHFVFNALAGIQNFINKNDSDNANRFMTRFARLTRNVLSSEDVISLEDEKALLIDYLEMEKLRFNFNYEIEMSPDLDPVNVEIPSMLLQPLIENSVKHGVSHLKSGGSITVSFQKENTNLFLLIRDNGGGFEPSSQFGGLGLDLTRKRIVLLNKLYQHSSIAMDIQSGASGTTISIYLKKWL